jgi:DnaJ-class molecular chaperone
MGRDALENGPEEPAYRYCFACGGVGSVPSIRTSGMRTCSICKGDGEIPVDTDEDEP